MEIDEIDNKYVGKEIYIVAAVTMIRQTSGPTVFTLKDNSGSMKATAFNGAGNRAFPDITIGSSIQAKCTVKERNGFIELEMQKYDIINQQVVKPVDLEKKPFLIKSEKLEKMRPIFLKITKFLKEAAQDERPIVIRHHDDTDGYTSGLMLEKALSKIVGNPRKLGRSSSRSPYYDYTDALRDLNNHLYAKNRFSENAPVMILSDLGSNFQSIDAIRRLKDYGFDFIIVDHHKFDKANEEDAVFFLNPHAYGFDSEICAGMLATELALFIDPDMDDIKHLPALAGTADKSDGEEYESYVKLSGFTKEELMKWAMVIDHETYYLRFQETSDMLEDLFFPTDINRHMISRVHKKIEEEFALVRLAAKKFVKVTEFKGFKFLILDREEAASYGSFASSKITRITHELVEGPHITIVQTSDSLSFRADGVPKFSVLKLLEMLRKELPYALVEGGGHDFAGAIKFNVGSRKDVLNIIHRYLKAL